MKGDEREFFGNSPKGTSSIKVKKEKFGGKKSGEVN